MSGITAQTDLESAIRVVSWPTPSLSVRPFASPRLVLTTLAAMAAVGTSWLLIHGAPWGETMMAATSYLVVGVIVLAIVPGAAQRCRSALREFRREREGAPSTDHRAQLELALAASGLMGPAGLTPSGRVDVDACRRAIERAGIDPPATVVVDNLEQALTRLEQTDVMLEPEHIAPGGRRERNAVVILAVSFLVLTGLAAWAGRWVAVILFATIIVLIVVTDHSLRRFIRPFRSDARDPVAGTGVVSDFKGKRWSVHDSMMIVRGKRPDALVTVDFIGPAGRLTMIFENSANADFVELWQRWNHPYPRAELLP